MMKMFMVGAIVLAAAVSNAASYGYSSYSRDSMTGLIGFKTGAVNFGVNYEHRLDTVGLGGYFFFSSEKKDVDYPNQQVTSFGGLAPVHVLDDAKVDAYIAPGFGIHMIKGLVRGQDDVTTFGPLWKLGVLYKLTSAVKVGAEHLQIVNWFTDKAPANADYTNVAVNFSF